MKDNTLIEYAARGVDQRINPEKGSASEIVNMRYHPDGFWEAKAGWEPLIPRSDQTTRYTTFMSYDILRTYVWTRHQGAETYYFEKRTDGSITYRVGNTNGLSVSTQQYHYVITDRKIAKPDDPDEQFIPVGRFLVVVNGSDMPLKFWGRDRTEQFGFTQRTPSPQLLNVDDEYFYTPYPSCSTDAVAIEFDSDDPSAGLGSSEANSVNTYRYRVSFISNTGSESPLSDPTEVSWNNDVDGSRYGVQIVDLPIGPPGTQKRRIYRSKNLQDFSTGSVVYYFVDEVQENVSRNFLDVVSDALLTVPVDPDDSAVISNTYKYGADWNGRFWLAGGSGTETRIIYSKAGLPEQFPVFNYFELGNTDGGAITALVPYYDNLLVFRQKGISMIRPQGDGFVITTLTTDIGTTATNTIKLVPGYGLLFLSYDGVYQLVGSTVGGSAISVKRISDPIKKEISKISQGALARASAAYSPKEQEWWCLVPVNGNTKCTSGIVFHSLIGQWSFRKRVKSANGSYTTGSFEFNDIATHPNGWFILAPEVTTENSGIVGQFTAYQVGLQVWSGCDGFGQSTAHTSVDGGIYSVSETDLPREASVYASCWEDFGNSSIKKKIHYVEVEMITVGKNEINFSYYVDGIESATGAGSNAPLIAEYFDSEQEEAILATIDDAADQSPATLGEAVWSSPKKVRVRWDLHTESVSTFKFRLLSTNRFHIISYQIHFNLSTRQTINQKAGR